MTADPPGSEHTDDGHYIVVDGRRWRATDPGIPEKFRAELVAELMEARRLVKTDPEAARPRVQDAKVALGERGDPWWEEPSAEGARSRVRSVFLALLRHRDGSSVCPSDIARVVGGPDAWRDRMDLVRDVAWEMTDTGELQVVQGGKPVSPPVRGPIRIVRGERFPGR